MRHAERVRAVTTNAIRKASVLNSLPGDASIELIDTIEQVDITVNTPEEVESNETLLTLRKYLFPPPPEPVPTVWKLSSPVIGDIELTDNLLATFNWSETINADDYTLIINGTSYSNVTSPYQIQLEHNTNYTWAVVANAIGFESSTPVGGTFATPGLPGHSVSNKTVVTTSTETSATISWNTVPTAESYNLIFNGVTYTNVTSPHTITGLSPGTSYTWSVIAIATGYADTTINGGAVNTLTGQLDTPDVTTREAFTSIRFEWDDVSNTQAYNLTIGSQTYDNVSSPYTKTYLQPGTEYTWSLTAIADGYNSATSSGSSTTTADLNVTATATPDSVSLEWSDVIVDTDPTAPPAQYAVYRGTDLVSGPSTGTDYTFTGLGVSETVVWEVRVVDGANSQTYRLYGGSTTTVVLPQLDAPEITGVSSTATSVTLTFTADTNATGGVLVFGGQTYTDVSSPYTVTGLTENESYSYSLKSTAANYVDSDTVNGTAYAVAPTSDKGPDVTIPVISISSNSVSMALVYYPNSGDKSIVSYEIFFSHESGGVTTTATPYVETGLTPETTYTYTLIGRNLNNQVSYQSSPRHFTTTAAPIRAQLTSPSLSPPEITTRTVTFTWSQDVFTTSNTLVFNGQTYNDVSSPHTISGLDPDTQYSYGLSSKTIAEEILDSDTASGIVQTTALTQLDTPTVTSTSTTNTATLTWNSNGNLSGADYELVFNGQTYTDVSSPYTINDLTPETPYSYSLTASRDGDYIDSPAATGTVTTTALPKLATPADITTSNITDTSFQLNWTASPGAEYYRVQINGTDYYPTVSPYTATGLPHNSTQSWQLQAIDTDGSHRDSNYRTGEINTLQTQLPQPTVTQSDLTYDSVTISWTPDDRASHYLVSVAGSQGSGVPSESNVQVTNGTYTFENLTPEIDYSWSIKAVDAETEYLTSVELFGYFTTPADTRPSTGAFTVTEDIIEDRSITLSWTSSTWADRYLVQCWYVYSNGALDKIYEEYHYNIYNDDFTGGRVHTIPDLQHSLNYKWSIQAQDTDAGSTYQGFRPETRTGTFTTSHLPTPRMYNSQQYTNYINLGWYTDDNQTGDSPEYFDIYWTNLNTNTGDAFTIDAAPDNHTNQFRIDDLTTNAPYSVGVRARAAGGVSAYRVDTLTPGKLHNPDLVFYDVTSTSFKIMLTTESIDLWGSTFGVKLNGASSFNATAFNDGFLTSSQITSNPFSSGDQVVLEVQQLPPSSSDYVASDLVTFSITLP